MRIAHFIDSLGPGGKERQFVELLKGLSARGGFENLVIVMSESVFYSELFDIEGVHLRFLVRRFKYDPSIFHRLHGICRGFRPEILTAWDTMTAICAVPVTRLLGIKFINAMIQSAPDSLTLKRWFISRITFPFSDSVLANSYAGLKAYRAGRGEVIHNGYDLSRRRELVEREEMRQRLGIAQPLVVGMIATFRRTKDQKTLVGAARIVLERRRDVAFVFGGEGETLEECRGLVREEDRANVYFLGRVDASVESLVDIFDIGVLATFTEGISNSIMEYMAMGKPVVATDGGGTRELVVEGQNGFLVQRRDERELATRILELLDDGRLRAAMGTSGRKRIEIEFDMEKMTDEYCRLYGRLTGGTYGENRIPGE